MIKRIAAMCMLICFALSAIVALASDEKPVVAENAIAKQVVQYLKLIDDVSESEVTRGEFAAAVVSLLGESDAAKGGQEPIFYDVGLTYKYYDAITYGVNRGFISVDENRLFRPLDAITYAEALKLILSAFGYDYIADTSGGYPIGYLNAAMQAGLSLHTDLGQSLNRANAVELLFKALNIGYYEKSVIGEKIDYRILKPWMQHKFDLHKIDGIIEKNEYTALTSPKGCYKGTVEINKTQYSVGSTVAASLLGQRVAAYALHDERTDDKRLIAISIHRDNMVVTIDAADIVSATPFELSYFDTNHTRKVNVTGADFIYNGKALSPILEDDLDISYGTITLIGHNDVNTADVVLVETYESYVVSAVDADNYIIYDKYGRIIEADSQSFVLSNINGDILDISVLKQDNVIDVFQSKSESGKKLMRCLLATPNLVEGSVTEVFKDGEQTWAEIGGSQYLVSDMYLEFSNTKPFIAPIIKVGLEGKFLINNYGVIVGLGSGKESMLYGFLLDLKKAPGISSDIFLKIYSQTGEFITCTATDNILINGERTKSNALLEYPDLYDEEEPATLIPQIIRYDTKEGLALNSIEIASKTPVKPSQSSKDTLVFNERITDAYYRGSSKYASEYLFTDKTIIFNIPLDLSEYAAYSVASKSILSSDRKYDFDIYNSSQAYVIGAAVLRESVTVDYSSQQSMIVVKEAVHVIDGDMGETIKLVGMYRGEEISLLPIREGMFDGIDKGDIIQALFDDRFKANSVKVIFKNDAAPTNYDLSDHRIFKDTFAKRVPSSENPGTASDFATLLMVYGICYAKEEGVLALVGYDSANSVFAVSVSNNAQVYVCDLDDGRVRINKGTLDMVAPSGSLTGTNGSKVLLNCRNEVAREVFVIR
ncbi:MAG: S-layer homology domain-containing protein [Firmicutes bacterium]|nr:S-layer homology domain-containing protein [Bacillota bacterium]